MDYHIGVVLHSQYLESVGDFLTPYLQTGPAGRFLAAQTVEPGDGFIVIDCLSGDREAVVRLSVPASAVLLIAAVPHSMRLGFGS